MITIDGLKFAYKKNEVLKDLSVELKGKHYVLVGNNGNGKTTLFRCISGFYRNYQGKIRNEQNGKPVIGYLPQKFGAYYNFTVKETLEYIALLKGVKNAKESADLCIQKMRMEDICDKKVKTLSGGMMKRLGIAQALIGEPDIVLLDEPTAALDIKQKKQFYELINELDKEITMVISTHILDDVRNLKAEILVLSGGKIHQPGWSNDDADLEEKYLCYQ